MTYAGENKDAILFSRTGWDRFPQRMLTRLLSPCRALGTLTGNSAWLYQVRLQTRAGARPVTRRSDTEVRNSVLTRQLLSRLILELVAHRSPREL